MARAMNWVRDSFNLLMASLQYQLEGEEHLVATVTLWQDLQKVLLSDSQLREKYMDREEKEEEEEVERRKKRMVYE